MLTRIACRAIIQKKNPKDHERRKFHYRLITLVNKFTRDCNDALQWCQNYSYGAEHALTMYNVLIAFIFINGKIIFKNILNIKINNQESYIEDNDIEKSSYQHI
jgi:hypothetical protein